MHPTPYEAAKRNKDLKFDARGIMLQLDPESDVLLVSCSGFINKRSIRGLLGREIIYAMESTTKNVRSNKIFLCDAKNAWYYSGIAGHSRSFDETVAIVDNIITEINPSLACIVGTSAGGYMALALAAKLGLDRALALSPQTVISISGRKIIEDDRWRRQMERVRRAGTPYDVVDLCQACETSTHFHVVYGSGDILDAKQAVRLAGLSNVSLYDMPVKEHNVSHIMRKHGLLQDCIDTLIRGSNNKIISDTISRSIISCINEST